MDIDRYGKIEHCIESDKIDMKKKIVRLTNLECGRDIHKERKKDRVREIITERQLV